MVASMAEQPHVLVVDDDAKIAAALRRALIYEGYQVEVAPDGQIALNRARERMPDLAILDIMMPGIDGLEVTRRLRAEGDVPILLLTAKDGTADRVKGLDSGADDYLVKPFAYEELLARVRALLRRRPLVQGRTYHVDSQLHWSRLQLGQEGNGIPPSDPDPRPDCALRRRCRRAGRRHLQLTGLRAGRRQPYQPAGRGAPDSWR